MVSCSLLKLLAQLLLIECALLNLAACFDCPINCHCKDVEKSSTSNVTLEISCKGADLFRGVLKLHSDIEVASAGGVRQSDKLPQIITNRIKETPKVAVASLDASYSALSEGQLEPKQFQVFSALNLENISLCCSNLSKVHDEAFVYAGEVGILDMSENLLTELRFVRGLTSLRELNLDNNKLMMVSVLDMRGLDHLQVLRLRGNRLINVNFLLNTLSVLSTLDVADNSLKMIAPKSFNNKTHLRSVDVSYNKIKIINYCLMSPLVENSSQLITFNMSTNPMYCGCHLMWISKTKAEVIHSRCVQPKEWEFTSEVVTHCSTRTSPHCASDSDTGLPWDPYATLHPIPGAGAAGESTQANTRAKKHSTAAAVQIVLITMLGFGVVIAVLGAILRNHQVTARQKALSEGNEETEGQTADDKLTGRGAAYRLSLTRGDTERADKPTDKYTKLSFDQLSL